MRYSDELSVTTHINKNINSDKIITEFLNSLDDYQNTFSNIAQSLEKKTVSRKTHIKHLNEAYFDEELVLVLGAGVSQYYGLPDWNTLLQKLLINLLKSEQNENSKNSASLLTSIFSPSPLILARNIQQRYKDKTDDLYFENQVRDLIYEKMDDSDISKLFKEIRHFCVAPGKSPNLDSVITFNYDDILENYLSNMEIKIPYKPIFSDGMQAKAGEIPIYHVHGFLPRDDKLTSKNKITISEDFYHMLYTDIYCWSNVVQIDKFTNNKCLFIGISFTDPNLRRLLDIAKRLRGEKQKPHYLLKIKHNVEEIKETLLNKSSNENHQNITILKDIDENEVTQIVNELVTIMKRFEEEDALSFGVNIIWMDDYDEIPSILSQIREL
ncbi:hypothetical protein HNV12_20770 [Methanococcoides sp. SA1]|nr:hypothetical protein [Methanococcoides sp. SA1]